MDQRTRKMLNLVLEATVQARSAFATLAVDLEALLAEPDETPPARAVVPVMTIAEAIAALPQEEAPAAGPGLRLVQPEPSSQPCAYIRLTDRERAVLCGLMDGLANKELARTYNIAEATVKVHVKALLRKLRLQNRTQAAVWGHTHPDAVATLEAAE